MNKPATLVLIAPEAVKGAELLRATRCAYLGDEVGCAEHIARTFGCSDTLARTLAAGMVLAVDAEGDAPEVVNVAPDAELRAIGAIVEALATLPSDAARDRALCYVAHREDERRKVAARPAPVPGAYSDKRPAPFTTRAVFVPQRYSSPNG